MKKLLNEGPRLQYDKPERGDYVRDGKNFGKILSFYGKEVFVKPIPAIKGVTWLYDLKYLKVSKLRNGQVEINAKRPVWVKK